MYLKAIIAEIKHEGANTHKLLERVPLDHFDWLPHNKSRNIDQLAKHVANIYNWIPFILSHDEIDFAKGGFFPPIPEMKSAEDLTAFFDNALTSAIKALENTSDEELMNPITMRRGEMVMNTLPKAACIRNLALNHLVHHRAQLGVYLRLLDIPIPGMYGPSADDIKR
jgi:uncharacterized damage-inducible protein DinB